MCGGAEFVQNSERYRVFFPNPKARLPVLQKDGSIVMVPWGRRENQPGNTPQGGWARLESIQRGAWQQFNPKPVKIVVTSFMEKDEAEQSRWFPLESHEIIQGLLATDGSFQRVYVVTEPHPQSTHDSGRWPRVISLETAVDKGESTLDEPEQTSLI
ncbi:hypothetical protein [Spartinivicinus poritis]|uniref:Uncharacterized protein n=1 Tax=Spartinivicinus poritis TaxID=2994640 RepID=A0ABT5U7G3_9GAMM|nr:hypothetical protein [Spartinivicinus sp. A2-2]MDE1462321.1 hypothetical protein [Spartinivicinus sp. A2-2]